MRNTISTILDFILDYSKDIFSLDSAVPFESIRKGALKTLSDFYNDNPELSADEKFQIMLWNCPMSVRRITERLNYSLSEGVNAQLVQRVKKNVWSFHLLYRGVLLYFNVKIILKLINWPWSWRTADLSSPSCRQALHNVKTWRGTTFHFG